MVFLTPSQNCLPLVGNSPCPDVEVIKTTLVSVGKSSTDKSSICKTTDFKPLPKACLLTFLATASAFPPSEANATVKGGPDNPCNNWANDSSAILDCLVFASVLALAVKFLDNNGSLDANKVNLFSLSKKSDNCFLKLEESNLNASASF